MGGCSGKTLKTQNHMRVPTVTGTLTITITKAHILHEASVFRMDPYLYLKVSNIKEKTKVVKNGDKQPEFNQTFNFPVNSCYRLHGRNLQISVFDKKKVGSDNQVGYGIVDLDPVINYKKTREQLRCFINFDRKPAGFVNVIAQFRQERARTLSFRFLTANFDRSTSAIGNMNCYVKVVLGEEILSTSKQVDTKEIPPIWKDDTLTFNTSESLRQCEIFVIDDKTEVGNIKLKLNPFLQSIEEQTFQESFKHKQKVAGTLKFQTLVGQLPHFSDVMTQVFKKAVKIDKKKEKEAQKKDEKKQEEQLEENKNKEEDKKVEEGQKQYYQQQKKLEQNNKEEYPKMQNQNKQEVVEANNS